MQRGLTNYRKYRYRNRETLLQFIIRTAIVFLCVYIAWRCINIISDGKVKTALYHTTQNTSNIIAGELVENVSLMEQYLLYMENHGSIKESAKKELLKAVVTDYIAGSEYTYDTSDPGYQEVINLLYENINAKNESRKEETSQQAEPKETKKKNEKTVKASANVIVPMPKLKGTLFTANNIGGFQNVLDKYYTVTVATQMYNSDMPIEKALNKKFKITGDNKKPQILIYHTHSQEAFCDSTKDSDTTIIGVGNRLEKILTKQFGYNVIHDTSTYDIVNGKLDRNEAYDQARVGVKKILEKYPTISLVLDIHRDGVNEHTKLVTDVNGKKTAQIMFFNGMSRFKTSGNIDYLYNPYLFENLALSLQMKVNAEAYYPGFTRRNYVNAYKYNLDMCEQCMLIEVGAQTNTYREAQNAADPLAVLIDKVLGKK